MDLKTLPLNVLYKKILNRDFPTRLEYEQAIQVLNDKLQEEKRKKEGLIENL